MVHAHPYIDQYASVIACAWTWSSPFVDFSGHDGQKKYSDRDAILDGTGSNPGQDRLMYQNQHICDVMNWMLFCVSKHRDPDQCFGNSSIWSEAVC